jgi:hypothetical protein
MSQRSIHEENYGKMLRMLVANLLKNAAPVPPALKDAAIEFESRAWFKKPDADRAQALAEIERATAGGSAVAKHYAEYPHPYSRRLFERFLDAQKLFREAVAEAAAD